MKKENDFVLFTTVSSVVKPQVRTPCVGSFTSPSCTRVFFLLFLAGKTGQGGGECGCGYILVALLYERWCETTFILCQRG